MGILLVIRHIILFFFLTLQINYIIEVMTIEEAIIDVQKLKD